MPRNLNKAAVSGKAALPRTNGIQAEINIQFTIWISATWPYSCKVIGRTSRISCQTRLGQFHESKMRSAPETSSLIPTSLAMMSWFA